MVLLILVVVVSNITSVSATKNIYKEIKQDTPDYLKEKFNDKYGIIQIKDKNKNNIVEYSLIENSEQCLTECSAEGRAILYKKGKLFDDKEFVDGKNKNKQLFNSKYWIKINESYEINVTDEYEYTCEDNVNSSNKTQTCINMTTKWKQETRYHEKWIEYNYEELEAGNYEWKLTASKNINDNIDFRIKKNDEYLIEWAWWNSSWEKKKPINISTAAATWNNYTVLLNITYDSDMNSDFGDLRFLESSESVELGYWVNNKSDSNYALVWINTSLTQNQNTTVYMYYNNSGASTSSNLDNVFTSVNDHGYTGSGFSEGMTIKRGLIINTTYPLYIIKVSKQSGANANRSLISNGAYTSLPTGDLVYASDIWATATFSGDTATYSEPVSIANHTSVYLSVDSEGSVYTESRPTSSVSYPTVKFGATWLAGVNWNEDVSSTQSQWWWWNIQNFTYGLNANPTIYVGEEQGLAPADTCTYTSGDWNINCFDNCSITDVTELDGGDLIFNGTGFFHVGANITNFGSINLSQGCYMFFDDGVFAVSA